MQKNKVLWVQLLWSCCIILSATRRIKTTLNAISKPHRHVCAVDHLQLVLQTNIPLLVWEMFHIISQGFSCSSIYAGVFKVAALSFQPKYLWIQVISRSKCLINTTYMCVFHYYHYINQLYLLYCGYNFESEGMFFKNFNDHA